MFIPDGLDMDEGQAREEFERVSSQYAHSIETSFQQEEEEDNARYLDSVQSMPPPLVPELLNNFGMTTEEIEQRNAMEVELESEYHERELRGQLIDTSHEFAITPGELEDELQHVEGTQLSPYATMGVSNDMAVLQENFSDAEFYNPYAIAVKGDWSQAAFVNLWGEGIGHHWATGAPDFNTSKSLYVTWWFIHVPITGKYWYSGLTKRLAFIYRSDRVRLVEMASEITYDRTRVLRQLYENLDRWWGFFEQYADRQTQREAEGKPRKPITEYSTPRLLTFIRQPHCAAFTILDQNGADLVPFLAVNAHLLWGQGKTERKREFNALFDWLVYRAQHRDRVYHLNMILLGDLNLEFSLASVKRDEIDQRLLESYR